jgi:hypothetical protein
MKKPERKDYDKEWEYEHELEMYERRIDAQENRTAFLLALADLMEKHGVEVGRAEVRGRDWTMNEDSPCFEFDAIFSEDYDFGFYLTPENIRRSLTAGD